MLISGTAFLRLRTSR
ncbi:erythromycin resistance leader peptide [uncultured Corynebacterium sp.]